MKKRRNFSLLSALALAVLVSGVVPLESMGPNSSTADATLDDPPYDYAYALSVNTSYTYYTYLDLSSGNYTFETKNTSSGADPVIYLFKYADTEQNTWMDDNTGGGVEAKITSTVSNAGTYVLLVRSKSAAGVADIYRDSALYVSKVPVAGTAIDSSTINKTGVLNYFTSYVAGDTRIWLANTDGKIVGFNDDYPYNSDPDSYDFRWGFGSRVKSEFSPAISFAIVSSYSPSATGSADVYLKSDNWNNQPPDRFLRLLGGYAIQSAPSSWLYNCFAWAGGDYSSENSTVWTPYDWDSDYYVDGDPMATLDNYLGNVNNQGQPEPRYVGAWTYTQNGATKANSVIDIWESDSEQFLIMHASVKKPGNGHLHGHDWESKMGYGGAGQERIFHPREAVGGPLGYGHPYRYYVVQTSGMSADEAEQSGLMVRQQVDLTETDKAKAKDLIDELASEVRQQFAAKLADWKKTWNDPRLLAQSIPTAWTSSEEYMQLLSFSRDQGKAVWPLLFLEIQEAGSGVRSRIKLLLYDLTLDQHREVMNKVVEESQQIRYTADGKYIVPSSEANMMRYLKQLLAEL